VDCLTLQTAGTHSPDHNAAEQVLQGVCSRAATAGGHLDDRGRMESGFRASGAIVAATEPASDEREAEYPETTSPSWRCSSAASTPTNARRVPVSCCRFDETIGPASCRADSSPRRSSRPRERTARKR
jgi:hypothetical protein